MKPTQEELMRVLDYDPWAGLLIWRARPSVRGWRFTGTVAGHLRKDGYVHVQVGAKSYYAHCVAWCWMTGEWPSGEVDHRDLNRANNVWRNLRLASPSQNAFARRSLRETRGIEVLPSGKFRARIGVGGKNFHLGCFDTIDAARAAYAAAADHHFGEFASGNDGHAVRTRMRSVAGAVFRVPG